MLPGSFRVYSGTGNIGRLLVAYGCTAVQDRPEHFPRSVWVWPGGDKRPQQDSNLRSRLRRVCRFNSLTFTDVSSLAILERCGDAGAVGCALSRWRLRGPDSASEARPGYWSGWLVLRVDAVLAEQQAEPLDLVGELLDPLGQNRQRRVLSGPLLLPRGLAGQQFLLPVTQ